MAATFLLVWYAWGWANLAAVARRGQPRLLFLSEALAVFAGFGEVRLTRWWLARLERCFKWNPVIYYAYIAG